jgi:thiol-disulfide isomerase/thioredoxin
MTRLFGPSALLLMLWTLGACRAHRAQHAELDAQITALNERVAALERAQGGTAGGAPATALDEERARALYAEAKDAIDRAAFDDAKLTLNQILTGYPTTRVAGQALRMSQEIGIIGEPVGAPPQIVRWFSGGPADVHLDEGVTLIVFFEQWCPHCQREIPRLQGLTEAAGQPVEVLALTRLTKTSTVENTQQFLVEHGVTFAVAQEDGAFAERAQVVGIPAAMIVRDGVIIWRGHPASLDEPLWRAVLGS